MKIWKLISIFALDLTMNEHAVISSSNLNPEYNAEKLYSDCEEGKFWRSPLGKNGSEAEIILDITFDKRIEKMNIRNGFGDFGTKRFSLWGSPTLSSPWTHLSDWDLPRLDDQVNITIKKNR